MEMEEIRSELFRLQDTKYRDFQGKLIPTIDPARVIGVRTPALRALAKKLSGDPEVFEFLEALPHAYFDENQLHAFLLSGMKDFTACLSAVERFLPYIDNWATCDQLSPKVFRKHRPELLDAVRRWIVSGKTYTLRFGVGMLMQHFLDADFRPEYPEMVAAICSEEYYVRMMVAWYFATALAKQYDSVLPVLTRRQLDAWTHNKTIQKAIESSRIPSPRKEHLRGLKVRSVQAVAMPLKVSRHDRIGYGGQYSR